MQRHSISVNHPQLLSDFHSHPGVLAGQAKLYIQTLLSSKDDTVTRSARCGNNPLYPVCGVRLKCLLLQRQISAELLPPSLPAAAFTDKREAHRKALSFRSDVT